MFLSNMFEADVHRRRRRRPVGRQRRLKVWRSFMIDEFAKSFAKSGGIGIAPKVYERLLKHPGLTASMSPITTAAEAEQAITDLTALIEKLSGLVQQETVLMHAGKIRHATALAPAKAELAEPACTPAASGSTQRPVLRQVLPERSPPWSGSRTPSAPCCTRT